MKKEIVIIEDNPDDAELIQEVLSSYNPNWVLTHFLNGKKAIRYLFDQALARESTLSLILLDLKLDNSSGFDVLKEIRQNENTCYIPVAIFSSSGLRADKVQSYQLGANCFVQKPVDGNLLFKRLSSLGDFWLNTNEFPKLIHPIHE